MKSLIVIVGDSPCCGKEIGEDLQGNLWCKKCKASLEIITTVQVKEKPPIYLDNHRA